MPRRRVTTRGNQNEAQTKNLDEATLKEQIVQNLRDQRQAYLEGLAGEEDQQEAVPTEMEEDTWLDAEHVDIAIQSLVSERDHLKQTVGICPVFNADAAKQSAQNMAIAFMQEQPEYEKYFRPLPPLPERSRVHGQARIDRDKEERRRAQLSNLINRKANALVHSEGLDERFFFLHLDGVTNVPALLGNPAKRNMAFKDCNQLIIPIRHHQNHYTVAVVHLTTERRRGQNKRIANIKYYDSMDGDLDEDLKTQLVQFLNSKGYEPRYENYSFNDQREGYNCSIFASYGAIDLANANAKNDERFLEDIASLNEDAYQERLGGLRQNIIVKLMQRMNITLSPEYIKQIKEGGAKVQRQTRALHQREELNRKINKIRDEIEDLLNRVKGAKPATRSKRKTDKKLSEIQPKELLAECAELVKQLKAKQEQLKKKRNKTNQDKINLTAIEKVMKTYHQNFAKLSNQTRQQNGSDIPFLDEIKGWFGDISAGRLLLYGALISVGIFVTVPYLSLMLHAIGDLVGAHPAFSVLAGLATFSGCYLLTQGSSGLLTQENGRANEEIAPDDIMELEEGSEEEESLEENAEKEKTADETAEESAEEDEEADEEAQIDQELEEIVTPRGRRGFTPLQQTRNNGRQQQQRRPQPQSGWRSRLRKRN